VKALVFIYAGPGVGFGVTGRGWYSLCRCFSCYGLTLWEEIGHRRLAHADARVVEQAYVLPKAAP
jgi:hypothetical protein